MSVVWEAEQAAAADAANCAARLTADGQRPAEDRRRGPRGASLDRALAVRPAVVVTHLDDVDLLPARLPDFSASEPTRNGILRQPVRVPVADGRILVTT